MDIRISQQARESIPDILLQTCLARSRQRFDEDKLRISPAQKAAAKGILSYLGITDQEINVSSYLQGTLTVVATPTCLAACLTDELPRQDAEKVYSRHAKDGNPFLALWDAEGRSVAFGQRRVHPSSTLWQ